MDISFTGLGVIPDHRPTLEKVGLLRQILGGDARRASWYQAVGTVGSLVPAGIELSRLDQRGREAHITIACAGHISVVDTFVVGTEGKIDMRRLIRRHGGRERLVGEPRSYVAPNWYYTLRTSNARLTVERVIEYLRDPVVRRVDGFLEGCTALAGAPQQGCDISIDGRL